MPEVSLQTERLLQKASTQYSVCIHSYLSTIQADTTHRTNPQAVSTVQYCTASIGVPTIQYNRILNPTSQTMTYGRQDSNADGHTKTHQFNQSTEKSTLLDVARRVVNRVMNSHQLII